MSIGTVSRGRRRIVVEFAPALAEQIDAAVSERAQRLGHATASDVIREAVAAFLLPSDDTNSSPRKEKPRQVSAAESTPERDER